jgi:hypothetical protein
MRCLDATGMCPSGRGLSPDKMPDEYRKCARRVLHLAGKADAETHKAILEEIGEVSFPPAAEAEHKGDTGLS